MEGLAKLKPVFRTDGKGKVTAGNSCGRSDAGAALLLVCDLISKSLALPINTVTALMGIPVVIVVVVRNRNLF